MFAVYAVVDITLCMIQICARSRWFDIILVTFHFCSVRLAYILNVRRRLMLRISRRALMSKPPAVTGVSRTPAKRKSHSKGQGGNQHTYHYANKTIWPSSNHKCVVCHHTSNVTLATLKKVVEEFGKIVKTHSVPMTTNVASTFEMATAVQAETVWKSMVSLKLTGVRKVFPYEEHPNIVGYSPYWCEDDVQQGLRDGTLVSGPIRVNPRMYHNAFLSDGNNQDILIDSVIARNRSLPGDIVAVKIRDPTQWVEPSGLPKTDISESESAKVKTADVVYILEKQHSRVCVGELVAKRDKFVLFRPVDNCLPRLLIPEEQCPGEYFKNPQDFQNKAFVASIEEWGDCDVFAAGRLHQFIGERGEIETETQRILIENNVDVSDLPEFHDTGLNSGTEFQDRKDLRSECVFTIDPSTAKDLDDALHIRRTGEDRYEVGVHIADVSHYVLPDSDIDRSAAKRCTTIYLVQKALPMLPRELCENLCSLNPGQDKLTYSVIWEMNGQGEIVKTWFGRTVIRSCAKLSYENAQTFIDNPEAELEPNRYPEVFDDFALSTLREKTVMLHNIAQCLRKRRRDKGALRLDQIKVAFTLDNDTGMPNSCYEYKRESSNELVEEFMLLANISVAHKLREALPQHAFLRRHPEPKAFMMSKMAGYCANQGIKLDISSSGGLAKSLCEAEAGGKLSKSGIHGLLHFVTKPQELALYFCAGSINDEERYRHFALNEPLYTHFTSPIRRYADIIVHRQLASIQQGPHLIENNTPLQPTDLQVQANLCNTQKAMANKVQDGSVQLFFYAIIKSVRVVFDKAVVLQVFNHSLDVLSLSYGQVARVYLDNLPVVGSKHNENRATMELVWPCNNDSKYKLSDDEMKLAKSGKLALPKYTSTVTQNIAAFDTVDVIFEANAHQVKIRTFLKNPSVSAKN